MLKALGISIYALGLLVHYKFGSNAIFFWCAFYMIIQNLGMLLVCLDLFNSKKLVYRLISRAGFTYFASAFVFYIISLIYELKIYFSQSGFAGSILSWLLLISVTLTLIDAYATRK